MLRSPYRNFELENGGGGGWIEDETPRGRVYRTETTSPLGKALSELQNKDTAKPIVNCLTFPCVVDGVTYDSPKGVGLEAPKTTPKTFAFPQQNSIVDFVKNNALLIGIAVVAILILKD